MGLPGHFRHKVPEQSTRDTDGVRIQKQQSDQVTCMFDNHCQSTLLSVVGQNQLDLTSNVTLILMQCQFYSNTSITQNIQAGNIETMTTTVIQIQNPETNLCYPTAQITLEQFQLHATTVPLKLTMLPQQGRSASFRHTLSSQTLQPYRSKTRNQKHFSRGIIIVVWMHVHEGGLTRTSPSCILFISKQSMQERVKNVRLTFNNICHLTTSDSTNRHCSLLPQHCDPFEEGPVRNHSVLSLFVLPLAWCEIAQHIFSLEMVGTHVLETAHTVSNRTHGIRCSDGRLRQGYLHYPLL